MAFTPRAKIVLVTVSLLALFLALLLVVLPTLLVNRPETRAALQQRVGAMLGGRVTFDQIQLMLVPRICVSVDHPRLDRPDNVSGGPQLHQDTVA